MSEPSRVVFPFPCRRLLFGCLLIVGFAAAGSKAASESRTAGTATPSDSATPSVVVEHGAPRPFEGRIARGLPSETPFYIQRAPRPGPTVLVVGGIHGDEPAGVQAVEQIRHWPLARGRLVSIPRANPLALEHNSRRIPDKPRGEDNLNRNFPTTRSGRGVRGPTAEHLWEFVNIVNPDFILDLHEGFDFRARNPDSVGSTLIHFDDDVTGPIARRMLATVNAEIEDEEKKFRSLTSGPVDGSLVRAAVHFLDARGMLLETTWKDQPLSWRTRQHRLLVHVFLRELGMVEGGAHVLLPPRRGSPEGESEGLRVALYDDEGTGGEGVGHLTRIVGEMPGAHLRCVGGADIRDGVLDSFDVVVFPGGRGGAQGRNLGEAGRERVRRFVEAGGGYVGICAGAYLATCRSDDYLRMLRAYHHSPWRKGRGPVLVELTEAGRRALGSEGAPPLEMRYANGPLFFHEDGHVPDLDLPDFEILATYIQGVENEGERRTVMEGTPAIVSAPHGSGRVLLIAPHPESSASLSWLVAGALEWAAGRAAGVHSPDEDDTPGLPSGTGRLDDASLGSRLAVAVSDCSLP